MMKRIVTASVLTALALPAIAAQYAKPGAVLTLKPRNGNAEFSINASAKDGSGTYNVEGTAQ
ncbi:hypothetical protein [Pantoea ananatis]|uniref:hypothetical protein n=1 Tax=Pantoea ananas TaxID=553 RepID=UPI0021E7E244|nr:hypothetical protein [Pantoea ananatis]MCW0309614.1 hypothetical protein [Pantoea ananatis]MCW0341449.1 hypothetical protein [Pantoea ananatis]MCW0359854.1 hypothetical protein [Pantoea ananatis]MCW0364557.1 hypothetical protein [Pantoea ananatis]MCW1777034.1 hypothetical protein [Pantoea ananatis]